MKPIEDATEGSDEQLDNTNSRWVNRGEWPFPFQRFGIADPIDREDEYTLDVQEIENARKSVAVMFDKSWSADVLDPYQESSDDEGEDAVDVDTSMSETTETPEPPSTESVSLADSVGSLSAPSGIISSNNEYTLHDNVARDLIKYVRSNTVRNEEQFLLLALAHVSGLAADPGDFISSVCIGTSSSGKSHIKKHADALFKHWDVMDVSTGTAKSLHHDDLWDSCDYVSMGELQQPDEEMLEFLKRAHGGDEEITIRQTEGNPSQGFYTSEITKKSKAYHCTYAQFDADFEFWNRLLKLPVHESESKNRAVGRMAFGHGDIDLGDNVEYGYQFDDGTERLQAHMLEFKRNAPKRAVLPNGGDGFDWSVWGIIEPIFKHSRSESNRVYDMVANLIKASAMVNFHTRDTVSWNVRTDDGLEQVEGVVATAQDVANVVRCLDVLRATTHEIDQRKRAVVDAINVKSENGVVEGLEPIISYLEESDASQVNLPELKNIIDDLEANYLISVDGDTYTANNWDALGEPRIDEYARFFTDCEDPMSGDPFLEWWDSRRDETETRGSDLFTDPELKSTGNSLGTDAGVKEQTVDFDVDAEPWVADVLGQIQTALDGVRVPDMSQLTVEGFIGLTGPDSAELTSVSTSGSMLDPEHPVWDVDDKPDSWVTTETDARRHIQQAIQQLMELGHIDIARVHESENGEPIDVTLVVGEN